MGFNFGIPNRTLEQVISTILSISRMDMSLMRLFAKVHIIPLSYPTDVGPAVPLTISDKILKETAKTLRMSTQSLRECELQFWPESLTWDQSSNWTENDAIGGSLPIPSWGNLSGRPFTFDSILYREEETRPVEEDLSAQDKYNIDINAKIRFLRGLMHPRLEAGMILPPVPLLLYFPKTELDPRMSKGQIRCVMSEMSVEYRAWYPSGVPKLVTVSLTFLEYADFEYGAWRVRDDFKPEVT